ncbi:hypothetical protein [Actinokineospora inagensis]|uniref:hypothetical protein n=1 Tax=Actinokineospora inagensis TaxID=103730 RepID=UPI00047B9FDF|nr:hypothetical protein [Actinokineospora inagensis]
MRGLRKVTIALVALPVLLAGCTRVISPPVESARAIPRYTPPKPDLVKILGDLTTLDMCSLIDPADFGNGKPITLGSWDVCSITVTAGAGAATISVGDIDLVDTLGPRTAPTELLGFQYSQYTNGLTPCGRVLPFTNDNSTTLGLTLRVDRATTTEGSSGSACGQLAQGFEKTLRRLRDKPQLVKHHTFTPAGLATIDPCGTVPRASVAAFPTKKNWPGRHNCEWTDASKNTTLRVTFGRSTPDFDKTMTNTVIAGRPTSQMQVPSGPGSMCLLFTNGPKDQESGGSENAMIALTVRDVADAAVTCTQATQLANQIWPVLPPPR